MKTLVPSEAAFEVLLSTLLTGATGFVGSYMQQVRLCVPLLQGDGLPVDLRVLGNLESQLDAFAFDSVIHLAAQTFVPRSFEDPRRDIRRELDGYVESPHRAPAPKVQWALPLCRNRRHLWDSSGGTLADY